MTVYFATDHAGFEMKQTLLEYVRDELGYVVEDCGAFEHDPDDDYPDVIQIAAKSVSAAPNESRAIIFGGSGQGEAMVANRFSNVRAAVYYGRPKTEQFDAAGNQLSMIESTRIHNDANVLSLGARFLEIAEAKEVLKKWLETSFSGDERHIRRIKKF